MIIQGAEMVVWVLSFTQTKLNNTTIQIIIHFASTVLVEICGIYLFEICTASHFNINYTLCCCGIFVALHLSCFFFILHKIELFSQTYIKLFSSNVRMRNLSQLKPGQHQNMQCSHQNKLKHCICHWLITN